MIARPAPADTGLGVSFICSAVIHLAVFLLIIWLGRLVPESTNLQETYYVDVVNLPVAEPRAGSPTQKGNDSEPAPPPPVTPENPMALPQPPKPAAKNAKTAAKAKEPTSESSAFAERMTKLERKAEAQHEAASLAQLQKRVKSSDSGRSGMPKGSGKEAGSDYTAYIKSRLEDALENNTNYSSKNPVMEVRLFIDPNGKLTRRKIEQSSGDRAFEISVLGAIERASEKFPPPPSHKMYEGVFIIKPQGINLKRP